MTYPIAPTAFPENPFNPAWVARDFFYSQDGIGEHPEHACKRTFEKSAPFISGVRNAIDIGCRDGEYSRYLQTRFTHVYGFDPRRREYLPFNVDLGRMTHFLCALGDEPGTIKMSGGTHNPHGRKQHYAPCFTLDSFNLQDIDYVKIDVEGFEKKVLIGGWVTIERCRPMIVIEQNDVVLPGASRYEARDWLEQRGYSVAAISKDDLIMVPQ
ncbi:methyltransferase [Caulobacter phage CcrColossus]|uniref:Putative FkbM-like methyltransferase n=1 Tax=Caulobacter phage CcrColossus TaxID=1211640 RepID=K4JUF8_9CAUD|nr:methyltransferase [Caulobacter phage CcrColossus]AFU87970.1 putative FkbM-like methyltransferase [Caulobacter phage CcrColossus]